MPFRWRGLAVDDGEIDPLGLTTSKLRLQALLRGRILGEHHEARRVLVDAVDDERAALGVGSEALLNLDVDGGHVRVALERNREDPRRLVDHDQQVVFVDDVELARGPGARPRLRAARAVNPDADGVAGREPARRIRDPRLFLVDEDLAALERRHGLAPGPETFGRGEELVETNADVSVPGAPAQVCDGHHLFAAAGTMLES